MRLVPRFGPEYPESRHEAPGGKSNKLRNDTGPVPRRRAALPQVKERAQCLSPLLVRISRAWDPTLRPFRFPRANLLRCVSL